MKKMSRKQLIAVASIVAGLLILLLVLLLFSCGTDETDGGRKELLYPAVTTVRENGGFSESLGAARPSGYPAEIGNALAVMMSLHEGDDAYLYHVAFRDSEAGDASTKESILRKLAEGDALYADHWAEIPPGPSQAQGWFYFLFTADEIRTLAGAGMECRFVGSGEETPDLNGGSELAQIKEKMCQYSGDSFRAEK